MKIDLRRLPYLENIGSCAMCGKKLPPLPKDASDDRLFCLNSACALLALHAGNEELVS